MSLEALVASSLALVVVALALVAFGRPLRVRLAGRLERRRRSGGRIGEPVGDREVEAENRAEELMISVIGADGLEAYRALGFLYAFGDPEGDGRPGYGYLIYPHRPIVSFDARSGALLSELCVRFPDTTSAGPEGERLPDADDVLAKWMAISGDELGLLAEANVHSPGRQVDPEQARRDVVKLGEWTASASDSPSDGPSDGFATAQ